MPKLRNHNIILPKYLEMVKKKGSSLIFSAHGWWGKEKNPKPAKKIRQPESEDGSAGGGQGEECRAVRASKPRRLFVRTEASREVFFSLIEKIFRGRAKEKIVKKTSLLDTRAKRAAAGRSELVGILFKMSSDFFQQTPPKFIYSGISLARGFAPRFGWHFRKEMPRIFEINRQFSRHKAAVHKFKNLYCGKVAMSRWFSSAFSGIQNEIMKNPTLTGGVSIIQASLDPHPAALACGHSYE